jgi:hypothetical protein
MPLRLERHPYSSGGFNHEEFQRKLIDNGLFTGFSYIGFANSTEPFRYPGTLSDLWARANAKLPAHQYTRSCYGNRNKVETLVN